MSNNATKSPCASIADLLNDPKYTDMTIVCDGKEFKVHRAIVCSQSKVLAKEIDSNFKESNGVIEHKEYDRETVDRMLQYMYSGDYQVPMFHGGRGDPELESLARQRVLGSWSERDEEEPDQTAEIRSSTNDSMPANDSVPAKDHLIAHLQVHGIASYYDVPMLKVKAKENFQLSLSNASWNRDDYIELVNLVYQYPKSEYAGLRASLVKFAIPHCEELMSNEDFRGMLEREGHLNVFCIDMPSKVVQHAAAEKSGAELMEKMKARRYRKVLDEKMAAEDSALSQRESIDRAIRTLNAFKKCRHCEEGRNATIERDTGDNGYGDYVVRCLHCRTRHRYHPD